MNPNARQINKKMKQDKPKEISPEYLVRAATFHLQKFDTTSEGLRKVLKRRVLKRCMGTDRNPDDYADAVEHAVKHCLDRSYVDDERYSNRFVERSLEKGIPKREIQSKLTRLGISDEMIQSAIEDNDYSEHDAALAYAKKRKIGMFRIDHQDKYKEKDLAAMARKGFSYEISSKIVTGSWRDETY